MSAGLASAFANVLKTDRRTRCPNSDVTDAAQISAELGSVAIRSCCLDAINDEVVIRVTNGAEGLTVEVNLPSHKNSCSVDDGTANTVFRTTVQASVASESTDTRAGVVSTPVPAPARGEAGGVL